MMHSAAARRNRMRLLKQYWPAYLLVLPVVIWYLTFCYAPMGGIAIAFQDYKILKGIFRSKFIGLENFREMFRTPTFPRAIRNTLIISILNLSIGFPVPIVFAILLNEMTQLRYKKTVQTISYLPHFISWSVTGGLVYMLLSPSTGAIAGVVRAMGGQPVNYIGISKYFRSIVVVSAIWKNMGWSAIIYMSAITGVDEQLYEAAIIDGAGRFQRIWHVTLPGIRPVIAIQLILAVGNILNVNFSQIFILINDLTLDVGETIDYYVYRVGLGAAFDFGLATASGLIKSVIGFLLIVIVNAISRKLTDGEGIW